ncbi:MAG: NAD-dependent epimerase/dehydratase family protein [Acidimicrobiales bacterium]
MESAHKRQRIAVAGATGGVGRHVVGVLTDRGHDVLAISRCVGCRRHHRRGARRSARRRARDHEHRHRAIGRARPRHEFFTTAARNLAEAGERAGMSCRRVDHRHGPVYRRARGPPRSPTSRHG